MKIDIGPWSVRSFRSEDVAFLPRHLGNPRVLATLTDAVPFPYTEDHASQWVECVTAQKLETQFAIAGAEGLIGGIGFKFKTDVYRQTAEIGYWIAEPYWGRGIATSAVREMTRYAFDRYPIVRIYASVFESNPASMRVLEKAGYELEARLRRNITKNDELLDELIFAILK